MVEINVMESLLDEKQDNALLRFTMGSAFLKHRKYSQALEQFARAVELKPDFTSAWLLYAQTLLDMEQVDDAADIIRQGILVAEKKRANAELAKLQALLSRIQGEV